MSEVSRTVGTMMPRSGTTPTATAPSVTPRSSRRIAGNDVDEALVFFGDGYDFRAPRVRRTHQQTPWSFAGVGDDRVSLRSSRLMVDLRTESQTDDAFLVAWMRSGSSTLTFEGASVELEAGVPIILPFGSPYTLHHRDIALNLVHLDRDFVRSVVGDDEFAFEPLRRPTAEGKRIWQDTVRAHSSRWLDVGNDLGPVEQRDIAEAFVRAAIAAFPERSRWRGAVTGSGPEHDRLRRALEFVHDHAREPIGTSEIAAASGLSPRGLQQSLRRNLGQTPGDVLRAARLDGARTELLRGAPDSTTVAQIARTWGFGHLGRFSASYRSRFGELPSESLRTG